MKFINILLLSLTILVTACSSANDTTVFENINGYSIIGDELIEFKSVAIRDGKFLEVSKSTLEEKYPNATIMDGNGKTMLPGLIDAHGHVMGLGFQQ